MEQEVTERTVYAADPTPLFPLLPLVQNVYSRRGGVIQNPVLTEVSRRR